MDTDAVREQQRASWERFSPGWRSWDDLVMAMLAPVGAVMVSRLAPVPTTVHLDIATGTGEPGLTIAGLAPEGRVVLTDLALGMLEGARATAEQRGLDNVELREADACDLPFGDQAFDSVSCRFGFMFFPDPQLAADEMARVLRPGGVVTTAVWADAASNPWAALPMAEIGKVVEVPVPPPGAPGLFRCAAPGYAAELFAAAGLEVLAEEDVSVTSGAASPEHYWTFMREVAAPVVAGLAAADDAQREQITAGVLAAAAAFDDGERVAIPGLARVTTARRPS